MKLYVDDVRTPPAGWRLARTVAEAQALLERETVEEVSLDYYIGDGEGGTFLPVAETIAALPEDRRPRRVRLHSASDAGAARMARVLSGRVPEIIRCPLAPRVPGEYSFSHAVAGSHHRRIL